MAEFIEDRPEAHYGPVCAHCGDPAVARLWGVDGVAQLFCHACLALLMAAPGGCA